MDEIRLLAPIGVTGSSFLKILLNKVGLKIRVLLGPMQAQQILALNISFLV
jgi:hypothetical protein